MPQDEKNENNCFLPHLQEKKVTSCVSKINFLLQLHFIINSLMCLSDTGSLYGAFVPGAGVQQIAWRGASCQHHPLLECAELEEVVLAL